MKDRVEKRVDEMKINIFNLDNQITLQADQLESMKNIRTMQCGALIELENLLKPITDPEVPKVKKVETSQS